MVQPIKTDLTPSKIPIDPLLEKESAETEKGVLKTEDGIERTVVQISKEKKSISELCGDAKNPSAEIPDKSEQILDKVGRVCTAIFVCFVFTAGFAFIMQRYYLNNGTYPDLNMPSELPAVGTSLKERVVIAMQECEDSWRLEELLAGNDEKRVEGFRVYNIVGVIDNWLKEKKSRAILQEWLSLTPEQQDMVNRRRVSFDHPLEKTIASEVRASFSPAVTYANDVLNETCKKMGYKTPNILKYHLDFLPKTVSMFWGVQNTHTT